MKARIQRFFQEVGKPLIPGEPVAPPSPDELQRFMEVAYKHGHWLGSPEENAAVGINIMG